MVWWRVFGWRGGAWFGGLSGVGACFGLVVAAVLAGGDELVFDGLRRQVGVRAYGAEVGNDEEDSLRLLAYLGIGGGLGVGIGWSGGLIALR